MRVAARITWAAALISATAVFTYAAVNQRDQNSAVAQGYRAQAQSVAAVIRTGLEAREDGLNIDQLQRMARESTRDIVGWTVTVIPRSAMATARTASPAVRRLRALDAARAGHIWTESDGVLLYTLPLLVSDPTSPHGTRLIGSVEVSRMMPIGLGSWTASLGELLAPCFLIVFLVALAVRTQTRRVVSQPIEKLLVGMDDVTKGDLTHALLAEREDEIGQLASHFNDMTQSLREAQAETQTQTHARASAEKELQKAEKMATIGQLAAEIAHEVGTPLNVIAGRARAMGRKASDPAQVTKNADIIFEQSSRITRIIQRLLDFSRKKALEQHLRIVDLGEILSTTLEFLESRLSQANVVVSLAADHGTAPVEGYPDQLQQVFINLVLNAAEAMQEGGPLEVRVRRERKRRPGLEMAPEQDCAVVEIADGGPGIPEGHRDRVFEPFYTTKEDEGGTGLGLAVSSSIIKEHDGWIEVGADVLGGALFRVCIPEAVPEQTE